jgi:hypothetical protein
MCEYRKGGEIMRMKIFNLVRGAAKWIGVLLEVRLPMGAANGLRTR